MIGNEKSSSESASNTTASDDSTWDAPYVETPQNTRTTELPKNWRLISEEMDQSGGFATTANGLEGLPPNHQRYWTKRGIAPDLAARYGVRGIGQTIVFDYLRDGSLFNSKLRKGKGNMPWAHTRDELIFWNIDCLTPEPAPDEFVIITEGEPDALSFLQCGFSRVLSLPNGAHVGKGGYKFFFEGHDKNLLPNLRKFTDFVIAVDDDAPGRACRDQLLQILGVDNARVFAYPEGCKDANEILVRFGPEVLGECVRGARHVWRNEIRSLHDVPEPAITKPYECGIEGLDRHGFRLVPPGLMAIAGPYGSGKSVLLRQVLARCWELHGWRFLLTSFEEGIKYRLANSLARLLSPGVLDFEDRGQVKAAYDRVDQACRFLTRPEHELATPAWLIERIETAIKREGVRVVAIDPVNEIDHVREGRESETEYLCKFIMDLKRIAHTYNVMVIALLHPTKFWTNQRGRSLMSLNDVSGSAHWGNKADVGWCVSRPFTEGAPSILHIDKCKDEQLMGRRTVAQLFLTEAREEFTANVIGYKGFFHKGESE